MITSPSDLEQCLTYFTQGNWWNWIGGGLTVIGFFFTFIFKKTLPQLVMDLAGFLMQKAQKAKPPSVEREQAHEKRMEEIASDHLSDARVSELLSTYPPENTATSGTRTPQS